MSGRGLRKLVFGNLSYAFGELYRGINIAAQVEVLQKFVPSLRVSDVVRSVIFSVTTESSFLDSNYFIEEYYVVLYSLEALGKLQCH